MEAWEPHAGIRPIPPDEPAAPGPPPPPYRPRWLSAGFVLAGLAAFGLVALWLGRVDVAQGDPTTTTSAPDETVDAAIAAAPQPTTTTSTAAPTTSTTRPQILADLAPGLDQDLSIYILERDGPSVYLDWNQFNIAPLTRQLIGRTADLKHDASDFWYAYLTFGRDSGTLFLGAPGGAEVGVGLNVTSFTWHATEPNLLAWTTRERATGVTTLSTGFAGEVGLVDVVSLAVVDSGARLLAWADWGFAVEWVPLDGQRTVQSGGSTLPLVITTLYDHSGVVLRRSAAEIVAASSTGRFVASDSWAGFEALGVDPTGWNVDATRLPPGRAVVDIDLDLLPEQPTIRNDAAVVFTPNGNEIVQVFNSSATRTSVATTSLDRLVGRTTALRGLATLTGFVGGDELIALTSEAGDLLIVEWNTGRTWAVPLDREGFVLDVVFR